MPSDSLVVWEDEGSKTAPAGDASTADKPIKITTSIQAELPIQDEQDEWLELS